MLGNNKRLEKKLHENGGVCAPATVLDAKSGMSITTGNSAVVSDTDIVWKLHVRVEPDGQPPFEAAFKQRFMQLNSPIPGMGIRVVFDPDDHDKIALDTMSAVATGPGALGGLADMNIGGLGGMSLGQANLGSLGEIVAQAQQMAAQAQAQAGAAGGATSPQVFSFGAAAPFAAAVPPPAAEDPIDRLSKLADLHSRGVLTDAEFAAEKAKILAAD